MITCAECSGEATMYQLVSDGSKIFVCDACADTNIPALFIDDKAAADYYEHRAEQYKKYVDASAGQLMNLRKKVRELEKQLEKANRELSLLSEEKAKYLNSPSICPLCGNAAELNYNIVDISANNVGEPIRDMDGNIITLSSVHSEINYTIRSSDSFMFEKLVEFIGRKNDNNRRNPK